MKIPFLGQMVWGFQVYATPSKVSVLTVNTRFDCSGADG